jgi:hypothetical protein
LVSLCVLIVELLDAQQIGVVWMMHPAGYDVFVALFHYRSQMGMGPFRRPDQSFTPFAA